MANSNRFHAQASLTVHGQNYTIYRLSAVEQAIPEAATLPFSLKILLENLLRTENGLSVTPADIEALARWDPQATPDKEIAFTPSRVLMQDFTGVPAIVDLAAMRQAMARMGGDPKKINPLQPAELVIDHSVQVDAFGTADALARNTTLEFERNRERYVFLRWGQKAFDNFKVVPPETGIVHQVNLEYLARVALVDQVRKIIYPDTLVGTDSHTTMINGLGVLGWGVGGIEAEAAMLGQPVSMLIPQVVGFKLHGRLPEGATATDLVLTICELLRKHGVVGKFVEFFGEGLADLPLADRATIGNMSPEFGSTVAIFPVDAETLRYLQMTGRPAEQVRLVEAYFKEQGLFHTANTPAARYTSTLELNLASIEPSLAGPSRPQDRVLLKQMKTSFAEHLPELLAHAKAKAKTKVPISLQTDGGAQTTVGAETSTHTHSATLDPDVPEAATHELHHGSVVIAAITSCTNTSNPSVMLAAGLLARHAAAKGLTAKPWVKTSLAPGSKVVTDYLAEAGLLEPLQQLNFHLVGYGCTTCIGNSGPLPQAVSDQIEHNGLVVASVLSGNRNFEGRVHPEVRANYLASPPLVVAYALAGRIDFDWDNDPLGQDPTGTDVYLRDIWPTREEIQTAIDTALKADMYSKVYSHAFEGNERWNALDVPTGDLFAWDDASTYVKDPPYFDGMELQPPPVTNITGARVLALLGDSITTDHISPAGAIKETSPAGQYLLARGVAKKDFNSFGSRRGNHEVMMRGTFGNVRLRNLLAPGTEGGVTRHFPDGQEMSIFDAAMQYQQEQVPLLVLAGKEYGSGSSRDWAAKGTRLLGVRAVIAQSYERIHRSNLVGMGVLPLQFKPGESPASLGLTGEEVYAIPGLAEAIQSNLADGRELSVTATAANGQVKSFTVIIRIDTPQEILYYQHGGILPYVLRQLLKA